MKNTVAVLEVNHRYSMVVLNLFGHKLETGPMVHVKAEKLAVKIANMFDVDRVG